MIAMEVHVQTDGGIARIVATKIYWCEMMLLMMLLMCSMLRKTYWPWWRWAGRLSHVEAWQRLRDRCVNGECMNPWCYGWMLLAVGAVVGSTPAFFQRRANQLGTISLDQGNYLGVFWPVGPDLIIWRGDFNSAGHKDIHNFNAN